MVDHIGTITELLDLYSRMTKIYNKPNLPYLRPRLTEIKTSLETTETDRAREARSRYIPKSYICCQFFEIQWGQAKYAMKLNFSSDPTVLDRVRVRF